MRKGKRKKSLNSVIVKGIQIKATALCNFSPLIHTSLLNQWFGRCFSYYLLSIWSNFLQYENELFLVLSLPNPVCKLHSPQVSVCGHIFKCFITTCHSLVDVILEDSSRPHIGDWLHLGPTRGPTHTSGFGFLHCCWHLGSYLSLEPGSLLKIVLYLMSLWLEKEISSVYHVAKTF